MNATNRLTSLAVILLVITVVQAYVYLNMDAKHPNLEGHCYYESLEISIPINETRQLSGRCEQASCSDEYTLEIAGCGVIGGYNVTETDYSKPYPECCPQLIKE